MKAFNTRTHAENDPLCRAVIIDYIHNHKDYEVVENPDRYGVDLLAPSKGMGLELERRLTWTGTDYPYPVVNVPKRKLKCLGGDNNNFFIILNYACTAFIFLTPDKLHQYLTPENLVTLPCNTDQGRIMDEMYRVPLAEFGRRDNILN